MGSRWPAVTGTWLLAPAAVYAVLAALELRELGPTPPEPGYVPVGDAVPTLVRGAAVALPLVVLVTLVSLLTSRLRRTTELLLAAGLGLGGALLWAVDQPRPAAPAVLAAAAVMLLVAALLPTPAQAGPWGSFAARVLLATAALLAGWVLVEHVSGYRWELAAWTAGPYAGLVLAALMLVGAVLGPWLVSPVWRWVAGVPLLLLGLAVAASGVLLLGEGYLVSGHEESEDGWRLGGAPLFLGAGLVAGGVAALRARWPLAAGTTGAAVLCSLSLVFAIPEVRSGF